MCLQQSFAQKGANNFRLTCVAPAFAFWPVGLAGHPALETHKHRRVDGSHQRHASSGGDDQMLKARRARQHGRSLGLHRPQVVLVAREPKWVRVAIDWLATQEVDLEALVVNRSLGLSFLAPKARLGLLQNLQHRPVQLGYGADKFHPPASVPQQVHVLCGECPLHDTHTGGRLVRVQGMGADHREVLAQASVLEGLQHCDGL